MQLGLPIPPEAGFAIFLSPDDASTPVQADGTQAIHCERVSLPNSLRESYHALRWVRALAKGVPLP